MPSISNSSDKYLYVHIFVFQNLDRNGPANYRIVCFPDFPHPADGDPREPQPLALRRSRPDHPVVEVMHDAAADHQQQPRRGRQRRR
mgnify:CR=1 FL=1